MTWGEFKAWMDAQGVRDDEQILYMDWSWPALGGELHLERHEPSGAVTVWA